MPHLKELTSLENLEVRILTVPEDPAGFEPFSRVAHAKLMAVDGERAWIGTANASKDYFYASRNVGMILEGGSLAQKIDRYFEVGWTSPHAAPVDVDREYPEPRISR
jgi:phosphatidylserine/phosphatidylglycerophosphate/cardiolipin synthase-like enzyme